MSGASDMFWVVQALEVKGEAVWPICTKIGAKERLVIAIATKIKRRKFAVMERCSTEKEGRLVNLILICSALAVSV